MAAAIGAHMHGSAIIDRQRLVRGAEVVKAQSGEAEFRDAARKDLADLTGVARLARVKLRVLRRDGKQQRTRRRFY